MQANKRELCNAEKVRLQLSCLALLVAGIYPYVYFFSGWIPHDEGLLGLTAKSILEGGIPHVDFKDTYTGGLGFLHSGAFKLIGESVVALRIFHLVFFQLFQLIALIAFFRILKDALTAALLLLALTVWTAPNYPASMPSWYVAYLGFTALVIILKEDGKIKLHWRIIAAGALAGLAFAIKLTGLYILPAAGLGLLAFAEIKHANRSPFDILSRFAIASIASWLPILVLLHKHIDMDHVIYFISPLFALALAYAFLGSKISFYKIASNGIHLLLGFAIGATPLLMPIFLTPGGWSKFIQGVFIEPSIRTSMASMPPPGLGEVVLALFTVGSIVTFAVLSKQLTATLAVTAVAWIIFGQMQEPHRLLWNVLRIIPMVSSIWILWASIKQKSQFTKSAWMVVSFIAWMNITQYPYAFGIYLLYCLPFYFCLFLIWKNSTPNVQPTNRNIISARNMLLLGLSAFAMIWIGPSSFRTHGVMYSARGKTQANQKIQRLGIAIDAREFSELNELLYEINVHRNPNDSILAFPDTPETYFLVGAGSPVPWMYDFFSPFKFYIVRTHSADFSDFLRSTYLA